MNKTKFCKIKYERAVRGVASTGGDTFGMSLTQYPCIEGCTGPAKVEVPNTGLKKYILGEVTVRSVCPMENNNS